MNEKQLQIIVVLIEAVLKYGPMAVSSAIAALQKEEPTLEDILALKIDKEPEEF